MGECSLIETRCTAIETSTNGSGIDSVTFIARHGPAIVALLSHGAGFGLVPAAQNLPRTAVSVFFVDKRPAPAGDVSFRLAAMAARIRSLAHWAARLLPRHCVLCEVNCAAETSLDLCEACAADLPVNASACSICAQPLAEPMPACGACQTARPLLAATCAPFHYRFPADQLVLQLKFGRNLSCASAMAELIFCRCAAELGDIDLIVPIPLHALRQFGRRFNQAEVIGRGLATRLSLPIDGRCLRRRRRTREQSKLARKDRNANVADAFVVRGPVPPRAHIGLIDDVITTGATIRAAAQTLLGAGAAQVTAIAFARAG